jgi:YVTN family beta-propeller protein
LNFSFSTADNLLLAVNPDSNTLSLVGLGSEKLIAEIPVGVDPRIVALNEKFKVAYVSNRGSNDISVVSLEKNSVIRTVSVDYLPYGIAVPSEGKNFFVAEQGSNQVRLIDAKTFRSLAVIPTDPRPSALAINGDGNTLYISHLLSSHISWVDVTELVKIAAPRNSPSRPISMGKAMAVENQVTPRISLELQRIDIWPDSNLVQSLVVSPSGNKAFIPHSRSNNSSRILTFDTTIFPVVSAIDLETNQHLYQDNLALGTLDQPGVGLPFDAAVTADEAQLWIVNSASNDLTVIDLATKQKAAHIEVEDNPRGIEFSPDGRKAYVNNTLAGTVSIVDTSSYEVIGSIKVTEIPFPPLLLTGKRLFYSSHDSSLALNQWISCNSCHFEGEHDGRTWFFNFAGPRNTIGLLGMIQTYPLRWSAEWDESADSEFAIRKENFGHGLVKGEMNCSLLPVDCVSPPPNQGRSEELDALAAYIDSLSIKLSPSHFREEALSESEKRGKAIFEDSKNGCVTCHPAPLYTDLQMHDVGTATVDERLGPEYDTPTLLGVWNSAPYFHDGSAQTLLDTIRRPGGNGEHNIADLLTDQEKDDLISFLQALPYEDMNSFRSKRDRKRITPQRK